MLTSPSALAEEFARRIFALLRTPILKAPPDVEPVALRHRSPSAIACVWRQKCASRAPNAPVQAQKVLVSKWEPTTSQPSDYQVVTDFQQSFQGPLDSSKRAGLRALTKFDVAGFEYMFKEAC
jgi:hypothetical protein